MKAMTPRALIGLFALALAACAPARTTSAPAAPVPARAVPVPAPPMIIAAPREAPRDWQLLDDTLDHFPGISAQRAQRELLAGKQPRRTVVVAVIDGGVDTAHVALRANLWQNAKEVPGNGKDDDRNGYTDDVRGWNFIGGRDGRDVHWDTYEVTRLLVGCNAPPPRTPAGVGTSVLPKPQCDSIAADFEKERREAEQSLLNVRAAGDALTRSTRILTQALGSDSLTPARVAALQPTQPDVQQAKRIYLQLAANHITQTVIDEARTELQNRLEYGLNPAFDPRAIVGDDYANPNERAYGNTDVTGPDAKHGTHVAGIIGAVRGSNDSGVVGVAPAVRLMAVRTVPDGDERDKDVANAIRYAVDNGAQIINMSFGKAYSPYKRAVDEAVKYADARGVLMIHAAGNDGQDVDRKPNFPSPVYLDGGKAQHWIEVGASSWKGSDSLAAPFSNYGQTTVDVFAPGVDILSAIPGGGFERQSGTSMAAPVVSGLAALLMAYYPDLTAADVKRIILASATRYADRRVLRPGEPGALVPFGTLSATGGIVNAYAAIRMAEAQRGDQR